MAKSKDINQSSAEVYNFIFGAPSFARFHKELLNIFMPVLSRPSPKRILVMGLGPSGMPYNKIPKEIVKGLSDKDSSAVFLDYSPKIIASCFESFFNLGIIGKNGLESQIVVSSKKEADFIKGCLSKIRVNPKIIISKNLDWAGSLDGKLTFFQHDLREPIPKKLGKFDFIDSSFTLHHISQYSSVLLERLKEIKSILKKGGIFNLGEGFCDMSYSEKKIFSICSSISDNKKKDIVLIDERNDCIYELRFSPGKLPRILKINKIVDYSNSILIDSFGIVHIPANIVGQESFMGYSAREGVISFPLIGSNKEDDMASLIIPVCSFYAPTHKEIREYCPQSSPKLIKKALEADYEESCNAQRGLFEYYLSENDILNMIKKAGFKKVSVKRILGQNGFKDFACIVCSNKNYFKCSR